MQVLARSMGCMLACFLFLSSSILAGTTGKIIGTVKDASRGGALIGADVVIEGSNFGASTDPEGYFTILNVPPGTYSMTVHYIGYKSITVENVRVNVDRTTTQHVKMNAATVEGEEEIVTADRSAIEMDRTHSSAIITSETVDLMPVTEVEEVLALQAGVVEQDGQLHFRGGRSREVSYVIDGVPVTNTFSQNGGNNVNVETSMIEELEVISGTFNAEYGAAQSGVVNIVTKKPASSFSGSLQMYAGDFLSTHNDIFLGIENFSPLAEKDIQLNISGPIIGDKLGFQIVGRVNDWESVDWYERRYNPIDGWRIATYRRWFQEHNVGNSDNSGYINIPDSLKTGDGSMGPLTTGLSSSIQAKLTFVPFPSMTLSYQGFGSMDQAEGPPDFDRLGADRFRRYQPDEAGFFEEIKYSHFLRLQHAASESFFYNLNFSYQHDQFDAWYRTDNLIATYPGAPGIQPIGVGADGFSQGNAGFYYGGGDRGNLYIDQYLANGDINWQIDNHNLLKVGFLARQHDIRIFQQNAIVTPDWDGRNFPIEINGADYDFEDYYDLVYLYWQNWESIFDTTRFDAATPDIASNYRDFKVDPLEVALYAQDKIEMGDMIVNAGLRLDYFQPNEQVPINLRTESFNLGSPQNLEPADTKFQLSPRLGISFPISAEGAFHASYGHFFQMPSLQTMFNEPLVSLTPFQLEGRRLGNANLKPERTIQYEIGLQQAITSTISVDVTAYFKNIRDQLGIEQITTVDNIVYTRYVNRDYGNAKGMTIGLSKRGGKVTGAANYTLAFANGSASDPGTLELINTATQIGGEDVVFPERLILPLSWDRRHDLSASINYSQSGNWSVGLVGWLSSGYPFDIQFVERFDLVEREYRKRGRIPLSWNTDLKAKKHFEFSGLKTAVFLKVDNLFDRLNHENVFATTGSASENAVLPDEKILIEDRLDGEGNFTYEETIINGDNFSLPRLVQLGFEIKF